INHFLENISGLLPDGSEDRPIHIIDFGSGKAYLTFALYYILKGRDVHITGVDLKGELLQRCQSLADQLDDTGLKFDSQPIKEAYPLLLTHGLLHERFAALLTDALRAEILKQLGYKTELLEFVDPEHTPKNLLIRATLNPNPPKPDWSLYQKLVK